MGSPPASDFNSGSCPRYKKRKKKRRRRKMERRKGKRSRRNLSKALPLWLKGGPGAVPERAAGLLG